MITKTGQELLEKRAQGHALYRGINALARKAGKGLYHGVKTVPVGAYKVIKSVAKPVSEAGVKGMSSTGKFIVKHPLVSSMVIPGAAIGAYNLKSDFKRNYLHTDPRQYHTYRGAVFDPAYGQGRLARFNTIKFRDPRMASYVNSKDSDNILY